MVRKGARMNKSLILGGLLGGLPLFVWGSISWMVLPWHLMTLEKFKDEATVAQALSTNAGAVSVTDLLIGWFLSGLVIAKVMPAS